MRHTDETIDFRLGSAQVAVPVLLGMALATGLLYLGLRWTADPMTAGELRTCAYAVGAGVIGVLILPRSRGARLTPECLVIFSPFAQRERRIPWADISSIDVRRSVGVRRVRISLVTGERLPLAAPMSFLDRHFEARVEELTAWWDTHGR
ncbi:hypothetical protein [Streptomyces sp. NBC_01744]|uniref:hypothetical protein n=1 Tax=Streptomyces sp. NBC_01744 TaxID=2975927 RepID=UPI003D9A1CD1|nr:hypothetical protein OIE70_36330 [Streptomyces sp. NBC_01744]